MRKPPPSRGSCGKHHRRQNAGRAHGSTPRQRGGGGQNRPVRARTATVSTRQPTVQRSSRRPGVRKAPPFPLASTLRAVIVREPPPSHRPRSCAERHRPCANRHSPCGKRHPVQCSARPLLLSLVTSDQQLPSAGHRSRREPASTLDRDGEPDPRSEARARFHPGPPGSVRPQTRLARTDLQTPRGLPCPIRPRRHSRLPVMPNPTPDHPSASAPRREPPV